MESIVIKPKNEILKNYVDYFLFFKKEDNHLINYITFPNNNLCLAIYKDNSITHTREAVSNNCKVIAGSQKYKSRLFGFHKMPFKVEVDGALDQVCILFLPAALRIFTRESYEDLMGEDEVFSLLFNDSKAFFLEQLFEEKSLHRRAEKIETLLLEKLTDKLPVKLREAFHLITNDEHIISIDSLSKALAISSPTLFRMFKDNVGTNPKTYIKTLRFRKVLNDILNTQNQLTHIAHANNYFDQAHFINDFKLLSGYTPKQILEKVSIEQQNLTWICNDK